jgi:hypothetical protein
MPRAAGRAGVRSWRSRCRRGRWLVRCSRALTSFVFCGALGASHGRRQRAQRQQPQVRVCCQRQRVWRTRRRSSCQHERSGRQ